MAAEQAYSRFAWRQVMAAYASMAQQVNRRMAVIVVMDKAAVENAGVKQPARRRRRAACRFCLIRRATGSAQQRDARR